MAKIMKCWLWWLWGAGVLIGVSLTGLLCGAVLLVASGSDALLLFACKSMVACGLAFVVPLAIGVMGYMVYASFMGLKNG